jgi:hypothetical protein
MPGYYVVVAGRQIVVRASADGHVTGSAAIPVPAGNARSSVGGEPFASADDRHFVIVVSRGGDLPGVADVTLFLLTVSQDGRPGKLSRLNFDSRGVPVIGAPVRQRRRRPGRDLLDVPGAVGGRRRQSRARPGLRVRPDRQRRLYLAARPDTARPAGLRGMVTAPQRFAGTARQPGSTSLISMCRLICLEREAMTAERGRLTRTGVLPPLAVATFRRGELRLEAELRCHEEFGRQLEACAAGTAGRPVPMRAVDGASGERR